MKDLNWKRLNAAAWLTVFSVFITPGKVILGQLPFQVTYGFPIRFVTQYRFEDTVEMNFMHNLSIDLGGFLVNILILYGMLYLCTRISIGYKYLKQKYRQHKSHNNLGENTYNENIHTNDTKGL